jgi:predicted flap endonuclease-1-like 5' DNA nuclease
VQPFDDPLLPTGEAEPPRSAEQRLVAALAALAARDGLLAERSRRLVALEDATDRLAAATARLDDLVRENAVLRLARRAELTESGARIAQLETALIEARRVAQARRKGPDNLQRIRGIGPVIDGLLRAMGITTFRQIAALSPAEQGRLGDLLGAFRGRIARDRWIEQAAELAAATEPRPPGGALGTEP